MSEIKYKDKKFMFVSPEKEQILLDLRRMLENKSRLSLVLENENRMSMFSVIQEIRKQHENFFPDDSEWYPYMLIDFLAARCLMQSAMPQYIAQIGAMNGTLSFHLASLAGQYHEESTLCCVCNAIGNESGNQWLDKVALVENPPKLSMLAADYEDTMLQENRFDLVVVNGSELFPAADQVLREAVRIVKPEGALICYDSSQPELSRLFTELFPECETFEINAETKVHYAKNPVLPEGTFDTEKDRFRKDVDDYLCSLQEILRQPQEKEKLREYYRKLDAYADQAMKQKEYERKVKLLRCKEAVLNAMYPAGTDE